MYNSRSFSGGIFAFALVFVLFLATASYAQKTAQWRPISPAELQMTKPVVEPDADAEALIWETRIDDSDDTKLFRTNYVRVKIFTERGREKFAKVDIPFEKGESKIKDIAARVTRPDGTSVELAEKDIFERDIVRGNGRKIRAKSFAVPNIEPGVIVEYQFRESYNDSSYIGGRFYLQKDIPVQNLVYYYKPHNGKTPVTREYNTSGNSFVKDEKGFYRLSRTNAPAFHEERYMPPEDMVKPYLSLADNNYLDLGAARLQLDRSNPTKYWGAVGTVIGLGVVAGWHSDADGVKKVTQMVIAGAGSEEDKLRRIYDFCQTKIRNASYDPSISDEQWKNIRKQTTKDLSKSDGTLYAGSSQINDLFASMATAAGFDTRAVYSSRRDEVYFDPKMTDSNLIRSAGVGVEVNGQYKVFNPGIKFAPFGVIPWYREDALGLFINEKNNGWLVLPMTPREKNLTKRTAKLKLSEDGTLEGTVTVELHGHEALSYRMENYDDEASKREENLKDDIVSRISNAEVSNISIENFDNDNSKPVIQRYNVKVPNYAQKTGKRLFVQPGFFEYNSPAAFASSERRYDVAFSFPWSEEDEITLQYPANYAIDNGESPPGSSAGEIASDIVEIGLDRANSQLVYKRKFVFGIQGNLNFNVSAYSAVKQLWDNIQKTDTATLSLKVKE